VSFHALKVLPVKYVKVDGSIVRKLLASGIARTKLNAVLRVAEATAMGVIAECVEEQEVLLRLTALGVQFAQGFGINQPQAIEGFAAPLQA
jgi:EAL domain-containing protein (putative c-di-GMP-specific phosphodiesterase class I)